MCAQSRNSSNYQRFLQQAEDANPGRQIVIITDDLSSHDSKSTRAWLEGHPHIRHAFIPRAPAGSTSRRAGGGSSARPPWPAETFADPDEITHATEVATAQLNARARPWIWGRPSPNRVPTAAVLCTPFEERSTRPVAVATIARRGSRTSIRRR